MIPIRERFTLRRALKRRSALLRRLSRRAGAGATIAVASAAGLAVTGGPSDAGDRSLTGSVSQTFLADTNLQIGSTSNRSGADGDDDGAIGSRTRLGLSYQDKTQVSLFTFGGTIDYDAYSGQQNDNLTGLFPDLRAGFSTRTSLDTVSGSLTFSATPVDFYTLNFGGFDPGAPPTPIDPTDPDPDPGIPNATADSEEAIRLAYGASVSYNHEINSLNSARLSFAASRRDFINDSESTNLVPSNRVSSTMGFSHKVSSRLSGGVNMTTTALFAEGEEDRETYTFSLAPTMTYARTPAQIYSLSLGPQYTIMNEMQALPGGGRAPDTSYDFGLRGSAGLFYRSENATLNLSAVQQVASSDSGDSVNRTSVSGTYTLRLSGSSSVFSSLTAALETPIDGSNADETNSLRYGGGYSYQVNSFSTYGLSLTASIEDDGVATESTVGGGLNYTYRVTEDASLRFAYDYRHAIESEQDERDSHRISMTLTKAFTLLP